MTLTLINNTLVTGFLYISIILCIAHSLGLNALEYICTYISGTLSESLQEDGWTVGVYNTNHTQNVHWKGARIFLHSSDSKSTTVQVRLCSGNNLIYIPICIATYI